MNYKEEFKKIVCERKPKLHLNIRTMLPFTCWY